MSDFAEFPNNELLEPYNYLKQIPGKDVRGHLIDAFNVWLQISEDKIRDIKRIIDALHNASLLIDDIEDGSHMRRGVPVAHLICKTPTRCSIDMEFPNLYDYSSVH